MELHAFRERLKKLHPILKGMLFTGLASITFFIEVHLIHHSRGYRADAIRSYEFYSMETLQGVLDLVITAPIEEELVYRGPLWILAMYAALTIRKNPGNAPLKTVAYALCAILGLVLNWVWAFSHTHHPLTVFAFGIVWGGCVVLTRKLHYSVILHAGSNALAVIGTSIIYRCSQ